MKLGDRICLLNEGRVEQIDTPDGFRTRPKSDFVKQFMGSHLDTTHNIVNQVKIKDLGINRSVDDNASVIHYPEVDAELYLNNIYEDLSHYDAVVVNDKEQHRRYLLNRKMCLLIYLLIRRKRHMNEFFATLSDRKGQLFSTIIEHIQLSFIALFIATLIAVPIAILLTKTKTFRNRHEYCSCSTNNSITGTTWFDDTNFRNWETSGNYRLSCICVTSYST